MKALFFIVLTLLCSIQTMGQSNFLISGKVIAKNTQEPLPYAQVALKKSGQTAPIDGMVTTEEGGFSFTTKPGTYQVVINFVGYKATTVNFSVGNSNVQLGTIALPEDVKQMDEVVVEGNEIRKPVKSTLEGLEVQPDQNISNLGGTLLDVLRNTPSVRVNDDGTISIRGSSGTNVLIDNRNSALTTDLEQIPASAIKKIEIINNPNARYDASSAGGVINIRLKKGENLGTSGKADATYGASNRTNLGIRGSHKAMDFDVYGGYSYRNWPDREWGTTQRELFTEQELLEQRENEEEDDIEHTVNLGGSYYFGQNKISYEGVYNKEDETQLQRTQTRVSDLTNDDILNQYIRDNEEMEDNYTIDNALIYERLFQDSIKEFRALVSNSRRDQLETQHIDVYNGVYQESAIGDGGPTRLERSLSDELRANTIIQVDYVQGLWDGKMEAGYKSTFRSFDNDYTYERFDNNTDSWVDQTAISNRFLYQDQIHAAYLIYGKRFGAFNMALGTRAEQTLLETTLFDTNEANSQQYLNFFPSVQASYNLDGHNTVKATYSRRIDRPRSYRLNPFPDVTDSLNVRIGNPNLQPEYINSYEVGHMFSKDVFNLTTNLYYRRTNNQVDWIVRVEDGISYRGPANLATRDTYGLEMITTYEIFKWWQLNASYSLFGVQVDGSNLDQDFTNNGTSWYTKFTSDFLLPWDINVQFTGNYESPEIEAQGRDLARYQVDGSIQRRFFEDRATISVSFRDIFNTEQFSGENYGGDFAQTFTSNEQSRIILASFSYNFGNMDS